MIRAVTQIVYFGGLSRHLFARPCATGRRGRTPSRGLGVRTLLFFWMALNVGACGSTPSNGLAAGSTHPAVETHLGSTGATAHAWSADFEQNLCMAMGENEQFGQDLVHLDEALAANDIERVASIASTARDRALAIDSYLSRATGYEPADSPIFRWRVAMGEYVEAFDELIRAATAGDVASVTGPLSTIETAHMMLSGITRTVEDFVAKTGFACS